MWCGKNPVWSVLFEEYDEDSNRCRQCGDKQDGEINGPLQGSWSRNQKLEIQTHSKDVLQPKNKDGTVNKHFVEVYGTKILEKEYKVNKKDLKESIEKYG